MPYNPDCKTPTEVYVNQTRIPAVDVDVYLRKDGPTAINRYAEVDFAVMYDGTDYRQLFDGLDAKSADEYATCHIRGSYRDEGVYYPMFTGLVTTVGSSGGNERRWQARAIGPELLASRLPFGQTYREATLGDVATDVNVALADATPLTIKEFLPERDTDAVASSPSVDGTSVVDL